MINAFSVLRLSVIFRRDRWSCSNTIFYVNRLKFMHFCPTFEVAFHCGFWVQSPKRKRNGQQDCFTSLFGAFYLDINQSHICDVYQSGLFDIILININFELLRTRVKNTMDTNYPFKTLICTFCAHTHIDCVHFIYFEKNGQCVRLTDHECNGRKDGNVACNRNENKKNLNLPPVYTHTHYCTHINNNNNNRILSEFGWKSPKYSDVFK